VEEVEVLIVEDDALNVQLLEQICRAAGYTTRVARDGVEGLEAIEHKQPDLVLLDVMMPRLDGYGVLKSLRTAEATASLPVVMVTALDNAEARTRCIDLGADDYVGKPFRIAELRERMYSTLQMSRFKRDLQVGRG